MGDVVATVKIMPEDPENDLKLLKEKIKSSIPEGAELHNIEEEPIAFGLVALKVMFVVKDEEGGTEIVEEKFKEIDGISSVEVQDIRRLM
ncbi:MAG: elongation factor 1-beta [Methanobrevibacter sp.]|jgi:elongation factor 1-beta|nr:elongation factor 1-beta [Candidatus Methanovirga basalitermitum]